MRVATRRLRAALEVFQPCFPEEALRGGPPGGQGARRRARRAPRPRRHARGARPLRGRARRRRPPGRAQPRGRGPRRAGGSEPAGWRRASPPSGSRRSPSAWPTSLAAAARALVEPAQAERGRRRRPNPHARAEPRPAPAPELPPAPARANGGEPPMKATPGAQARPRGDAGRERGPDRAHPARRDAFVRAGRAAPGVRRRSARPADRGQAPALRARVDRLLLRRRRRHGPPPRPRRPGACSATSTTAT